MAEVTRVPIQPIAKGSLAKLWLGVIIAALIGLGIAYVAMPKGLELETLVEGAGANPQPGQAAFIRYVGRFSDGTEFDRSRDEAIPVPGIFPGGMLWPLEEGGMIKGFYRSILQMQKGGKYKVFIPSDLAYGDKPPPGSPIPPGADLVFEVELVDFMSREDFERRLSILQQVMARQAPPEQAGEPAPAQ
ncbi:MAG: peptidylprolyl isomerase [Erythrobacter sp. RIFCSPHIGHO2_12_FULL_63_10]|nr:MAG: peptidylprolyl isomerase [Erythrobacter sp. RIFCSPHIGHO2_12_FULL_63_10]